MKALIVGQAPARSGDGTPFSGPSGHRLCQLLEVADLAELRRWFDLDNLITEKLSRRPTGRGDVFHVKRAEQRAREIVARSPAGQVIIACGRQVWTAFGCDLSTEWFGRSLMPNNMGELVELRLFPHPSGLSHFWNERENVERARDALKAIAFSALVMRRNQVSRSLRRIPTPLDRRSSRTASRQSHER